MNVNKNRQREEYKRDTTRAKYRDRDVQKTMILDIKKDRDRYIEKELTTKGDRRKRQVKHERQKRKDF